MEFLAISGLTGGREEREPRGSDRHQRVRAAFAPAVICSFPAQGLHFTREETEVGGGHTASEAHGSRREGGRREVSARGGGRGHARLGPGSPLICFLYLQVPSERHLPPPPAACISHRLPSISREAQTHQREMGQEGTENGPIY